MFRYLIIDGEKLFNYSINEEGTVVNSKNKKLKRRGNTYRLYVNGKHRSFNANDLIEWAFKDKKKEAPKEESYVDTTVSSYLIFEKVVNERGGDVRNNTEIINNFLTIKNPDLYDIDPNSNFLSDETKTKIIEECKVNPWYFFRRVLELPIDMLLYTTVKTTLSGIDCYIQCPDNYLYYKVRDAILTYVILFGGKDVILVDTNKYNRIRHFYLLPEDHWIADIEPDNILFSNINLLSSSVDKMKNTLFVNIDPDVAFSLSSFVTSHSEPINPHRNNVLSITPESGDSSLFRGTYCNTCDKNNLFSSVQLLGYEANKIKDGQALFLTFSNIELGFEAPVVNKIGKEGFSTFFDADFKYKERLDNLIVASFNETTKNYVIDKLRKDNKTFTKLARRVIKRTSPELDVENLTTEALVGIFSVIRSNGILNLIPLYKHVSPEDLIYILFGSRDYKEINDKLTQYDSFERHIMCSIYNSNDWNVLRNAPIPVGLRVEGFLRTLYKETFSITFD